MLVVECVDGRFESNGDVELEWEEAYLVVMRTLSGRW